MYSHIENLPGNASQSQEIRFPERIRASRAFHRTDRTDPVGSVGSNARLARILFLLKISACFGQKRWEISHFSFSRCLRATEARKRNH
jgi:hypothetical protein